jgi:hypothetical protein
MTDQPPPEPAQGSWPTILAATGSPLKVFALTVLVCNAFFGLAAAWMADIDAFTYAIHMFLAIVAAFVLTALWSPRSLYHPKELLEIRHLQQPGDDQDIFPESRPWVPTLAIGAGILVYAAYQLIKRWQGW